MNTFENPRDVAIIVGSIAPRTEEHPFAAQAQDIRDSPDLVCILTPIGKGIPIRKPSGAMMNGVISSLAVIGRLRRILMAGDKRP
jgi:hypothetical protein